MRSRLFATAATVLISTAALLILLGMLGRAQPGARPAALAAPAAPTVTEVEPASGPNDLDTPVVITGADFVSMPTVYVGETALDDVNWVSSTRLEGVVPWGMDAGVYTLTVENPGGGSASLAEAFTVTQAIGEWNAGELYGGDVRRIYMNPITPTTLYVTPHDIGLFRSRDGGAHWTFLSLRDHKLAIDPNDPRTIYAYGLTPQRSDDEGETWHDIPATFPNSPTLGGGCQSNVELYPHPETAGRVYATSCGGPFKNNGVLSSTNQGEDWEEAMEGLTDTQVTSLAFYPDQPMTMYVGTANGNVFISHDGGAQWSFASQPVEYVGQLAVNPFEPHEVWVSSDIDWGASEALLKSTNAELTAWTSVLPESEDVGWWGKYANIIFPPALGWGQSYSTTVFVAGMGETGGYVTNDSGDSWTSFGPSQTHNASDFALHPSDPDIIYMSDSRGRGVYKTTNGTADAGGDWQVSNHGLTAVKIGQLETVPGEPSVVYGQAHGPAGIYKATQGGQTWHFLPIPSGGYPDCILVDPITTTRLYVGSYAGIHISEDEGQNWTFVEIEPPDIYTDCKLFVEALAAHRAHTGTILAGIWHDCGSHTRGSVYRSEDFGENWTRIDVVTPGQEISRVVEMAYDPVSPTIVYAGVEPGVQGANGLHRSEDGGLSWERVGEETPWFGAVGDIAFERTPPYRVFASTILPSSNGGLYYSEDHGRTPWVQIDGPGSYPYVGSIAVAPGVEGHTSVLYAVGEFDGGLHRLPLTSRTQLTSTILPWNPAAGTLGQVPVYSLAWATDTDRVFLYAGTTGGYVQDTGAEMLRLSATADSLVNAGVYRYTTRRARKLYLPLVLRSYSSQ